MNARQYYTSSMSQKKKEKQKVRATVARFSDKKFISSNDVVSLNDLSQFVGCDSVTWINIRGGLSEAEMYRLGGIFDLDETVIEDLVLNKDEHHFESRPNKIYLSLKEVEYDHKRHLISANPVTVIINGNYLLTIQDSDSEVFEPIYAKLRQLGSPVQKGGPDILACEVVGCLVNNYIRKMDDFGNAVEELQDNVIKGRKNGNTVNAIYGLKKELNEFRKEVRPVDDILLLWIKDSSNVISQETKRYIEYLRRDIAHAARSIELYNGLINDALNLYNTGISNNTNNAMKWLAIITGVFTPGTFLAGVFGMNFPMGGIFATASGIFIYWGLVLISLIALVVLFKRLNIF